MKSKVLKPIPIYPLLLILFLILFFSFFLLYSIYFTPSQNKPIEYTGSAIIKGANTIGMISTADTESAASKCEDLDGDGYINILCNKDMLFCENQKLAIANGESPAIYNNILVYKKKEGENINIYLLNLLSNTQYLLFGDEKEKKNLDIDNEFVIWESSPIKSEDYPKITIYNIKNNDTKIFEGKSPSIDNGIVSYIARDSTTKDNEEQVFVYYIKTGKKEKFSNSKTPKENTDISNGMIAWDEFNLLSQWNIFVYNLTKMSIILRINGADSEENPSLGNKFVAYNYKSNYESNSEDESKEIRIRNFFDNKIIHIKNSGNPKAHNENFVYEHFDGVDNEIYLYNFDKRLKTKITDDNIAQSQASIYSDSIVWVEDSIPKENTEEPENEKTIYLYKPKSNLCFAMSNDCDDKNNLINPGIKESCSNKIDDNCDGFIDNDDLECYSQNAAITKTTDKSNLAGELAIKNEGVIKKAVTKVAATITGMRSLFA